jgi:cobalamin biosynthetic protein CobC
MNASSIQHGGDLAGATARFGEPKDGWLDLSTGVNPVPYPMSDLAAEVWQRLPQTAARDALITAAARYYDVPNTETIAAADGSQTLLQWLPRLLPPGRTAIVAPTYGEYAVCWQAAGHDIAYVREIAETADAQTVVLANPNNPDGRRLTPEDLLPCADKLATRGGWLIVDEAFVDTMPEFSLAPHAGRPGLVVLRSFGKFFGLAGLRLGFALAPPDFAAQLRAALGPWPVNGPALAIGAQALSDVAWTGWTRDRLRRDSARLAILLQKHGLRVIGGTTLFQLAAHTDAPALRDHLGRHGILVRAFADDPTWLRFGLPAPESFARLERAFATWRTTQQDTRLPA